MPHEPKCKNPDCFDGYLYGPPDPNGIRIRTGDCPDCNAPPRPFAEEGDWIIPEAPSDEPRFAPHRQPKIGDALEYKTVANGWMPATCVAVEGSGVVSLVGNEDGRKRVSLVYPGWRFPEAPSGAEGKHWSHPGNIEHGSAVSGASPSALDDAWGKHRRKLGYHRPDIPSVDFAAGYWCRQPEIDDLIHDLERYIHIAGIEATGQATQGDETLKAAAQDMLYGWRYIREHHGDLYGVGWDRAENAVATALGWTLGKNWPPAPPNGESE